MLDSQKSGLRSHTQCQSWAIPHLLGALLQPVEVALASQDWVMYYWTHRRLNCSYPKSQRFTHVTVRVWWWAAGWDTAQE